MAESLELGAVCAELCDLALLEEALTIWRELGAEVAAARVELGLAHLSGNRLEADHAEKELRRLGVKPEDSSWEAELAEHTERFKKQTSEEGDKVRVAVSPYDLSHGLIVYRGRS